VSKWSVALFGHEKYNWILFETEYNVSVARFVNPPEVVEKGWLVDGQFMPSSVYDLREMKDNIRRAKPGYVIGYKPYGQDWTDTEKKEFLIVTIDGLTISQIAAMCEPEFDLNSYKTYAPKTKESFLVYLWEKTLKYVEPPRSALQQDITNTLNTRYDEYLHYVWLRSALPTNHWRKRRFRILELDLKTLGVDLERMKDKRLLYNPSISVPLDACYDKLKDKYVPDASGLNEIKKRTVEEMLNPLTAEEILAGLRG
jgi:hypothetical protein